MNHKYLILIAALLAVLSCTGTRKATDSTSQVSTPPQASAAPFGLTAEELKQVDFRKPVSFVNNPDNKGRMVFVDAETKTIAKTIDIRENNPYSQLGTKTTKNRFDIFTVENKTIKDIFPNLDTKHYVNKDFNYDTIKVTEILTRYDIGFSPNQKYAAVSYTAMRYGGSSDYSSAFTIPGRSVIIVYDSIGSELARFENIDAGVSQIGITDDGNYLCYLFGYSDPDYGLEIHRGIQIYSIKEQIFLQDVEDDNITGVRVANNLVFASGNIYKNNEGVEVINFVIYNLYNNKVYKRGLKVDDIGKSRLEGDGIVLQPYYSDSTYKLFFEKDFNMGELK